MPTLRQVLTVFRAAREGVPLGDIAVMKFDMLSKAPPGLNDKLRALGNSLLQLDMDKLRALPEGTVGRELSRLLDAQGIRPLEVSPALKERFERENPYALRYTSTHDLFHVLTGFPTTPAGEIGLFAFMIAQGFQGGSKKLLYVSSMIYALLLPLHAPGMWTNTRVGLAMGKEARPMLEEPLEAFLEEPLADVRRRLGLPDPAEAGVAKGHESVLMQWFMSRYAPEPAAAHT